MNDQAWNAVSVLHPGAADLHRRDNVYGSRAHMAIRPQRVKREEVSKLTRELPAVRSAQETPGHTASRRANQPSCNRLRRLFAPGGCIATTTAGRIAGSARPSASVTLTTPCSVRRPGTSRSAPTPSIAIAAGFSATVVAAATLRHSSTPSLANQTDALKCSTGPP